MLGVSFLSLGLRAGAVVACSIPLVLAAVFVMMEVSDIDLQRVSLGALIIALGLLVDDAMITVEMMVTKLEEGMDKVRAATFAYTSTAFPMLTGTLVTVAGFVPVGFAQERGGRVHLFDVRGGDHRAADLVDRRCGVRTADRRGRPAGQDAGTGQPRPAPILGRYRTLLVRAMRRALHHHRRTVALLVLAVLGLGWCRSSSSRHRTARSCWWT